MDSHSDIAALYAAARNAAVSSCAGGTAGVAILDRLGIGSPVFFTIVPLLEAPPSQWPHCVHWLCLSAALSAPSYRPVVPVSDSLSSSVFALQWLRLWLSLSPLVWDFWTCRSGQQGSWCGSCLSSSSAYVTFLLHPWVALECALVLAAHSRRVPSDRQGVRPQLSP